VSLEEYPPEGSIDKPEKGMLRGVTMLQGKGGGEAGTPPQTGHKEIAPLGSDDVITDTCV